MSGITVYCHKLGGYGIERVCLNLVNQWAASGVEVTVVVAKDSGNRATELDPRIKLTSLKASDPWQVILGLRRYLRRQRPPLILAFNTGNGNKVLAAKYLALSRCRVAVGIHNTESQSARLRSSWEQKLLTPIGFRWLIPKADHILAVSVGVAADFEKLTGIDRQRIKVIYNPIFSESLVAASHEDPEHPWLTQSAENIPVIIGAGRLIEHKDFSTFLRVIAEVKKNRPVRAIILGQGALQEQLKEEARLLGIEGAVDFHGFVDNPVAYFARSNLFMLTSRWEGFGNVIVEALASGTPVVAFDCPSGPSEILDDRRYGRLAPVGDVLKLAKEVLASLAEEKDISACISRARDFADSRIADEYRNVLGF